MPYLVRVKLGMEEAEALCSRIGVMVNGKLCFIGTGQHLKHCFGNGYEINIKTVPVNLSRCKLILTTLIHALNEDDSVVEDSKVIIRQSNHLRPYLRYFARKFSSTDSLAYDLEEEEEWEQIGAIFVSREEVKVFCKVLACGNDRFSMIAAGQSGGTVDSTLNVDRCFVSVRVFLECNRELYAGSLPRQVQILRAQFVVELPQSSVPVRIAG